MPPRQPGFQDVLNLLVSGGGATQAAAAETPAQPAENGAQQATDTQEERSRALEQLFEHFRDAFGGENGALACQPPATCHDLPHCWSL